MMVPLSRVSITMMKVTNADHMIAVQFNEEEIESFLSISKERYEDTHL
jgi:hypothetical protein